MRYFLSLNPSVEEAASLERRQLALAHALKACPAIAEAIRWTRMGQMHLTLEFLGDLPEEKLDAIEPGIRAVVAEFPPARILLDGAGTFPVYRTPQVLWWRVAPEGGVGEIQRRVRVRLMDEGFRLATPHFSHVTAGRVGRVHPGEEELRRFSGVMDDFAEEMNRAPEVWLPRGVAVMRSTLRKSGAAYDCLRVLPFAGGAD